MSELWQFAHLKFHFGEELAIQAMNMPAQRNRMRTNVEMSELWQFAHLKFHFGEELAIQAMNMPAQLTYSAKSAEKPLGDRDFPAKMRKETAGIRPSDLSTGIA
jgi:hypothetical protein